MYCAITRYCAARFESFSIRSDDSASRLLFIANALKQHHIGLEEIDDGIWSIYFNRVLLARLNERDYIIRA